MMFLPLWLISYVGIITFERMSYEGSLWGFSWSAGTIDTQDIILFFLVSIESFVCTSVIKVLFFMALTEWDSQLPLGVHITSFVVVEVPALY